MNDQRMREQALDPTQSFIVQAPAGSGKTELLTQRFLQLLAQVNTPEEIIAITFTRKAAAEMRERILHSLTQTHPSMLPTEHYQQMTWRLAQAVIKKDQQKGWQLQNNPNRLRIITIDALSGALCAQIPLASGFGAQPIITEDARPYYQQAVRSLFNDNDIQSDLATLLLHLDNNYQQLESLLIHILSCREQWLPHVMNHYQKPHLLKKDLEQGLQHIAIEKMNAACAVLKENNSAELISLAKFAAEQLKESDPKHPITHAVGLTHCPPVTVHDFPVWFSLATLLLVKTGEWRKTVDKRCGFPSLNKSVHSEQANYYRSYKNRMLDFLESNKDNVRLKTVLSDILFCPPMHYSPQQWKIIEVLMKLLPLLAAQLNLIFMEQGSIDFTELTLGALRALGDSSQPTDLALHLDYQIQHLLIDEFQDTAVTQFRLIKQLLSGWQPGDGRSLFLVGDPMQSIYHFRHAEVGLFLRTQQQGIANIALKSLTLQCNFRSNAKIVHWVNHTFSKLFPPHTDMTVGAVPYTSAIPMKENDHSLAGVTYYPLLNADENDEAQQLIQIVQHLQKTDPHATIAIMVRSRHQLDDIIPALHTAQIPFQAVDIESLAHCMEIQDLVTLTRALFHLGDRIAWLSVLRAPYCGLTLSDLFAVTQHCQDAPLWKSLVNFHEIKPLSEDGNIRLQRVIPIFAEALAQQGRRPLAQWIKETWAALGGPACLTQATALLNTKTFFNLLEGIEYEFNFTLLENKLNRLYAQSDPNQGKNLHIMTIHKTKGLEFDHVILPGLNQKTAADKARILRWLERPSLLGSNDLILAPIQAAKDQWDPIYSYLKNIENTKLHYEAARLLYVAITRAKMSCHFICSISNENDSTELKLPNKGSFLDLLWPISHNEIVNQAISFPTKNNEIIKRNLSAFVRLKSDWQSPWHALHTHETLVDYTHLTKNIQFHQSLGTVIHEALEMIAHHGIEHWDNNHDRRAYWRRRLQQFCVLRLPGNAHKSCDARYSQYTQ